MYNDIINTKNQHVNLNCISFKAPKATKENFNKYAIYKVMTMKYSY